jgi:hypothetical protein
MSLNRHQCNIRKQLVFQEAFKQLYSIDNLYGTEGGPMFVTRIFNLVVLLHVDNRHDDVSPFLCKDSRRKEGILYCPRLLCMRVVYNIVT